MSASMSIVGSATLALIFIGRPVASQPIVPVDFQRQINTYTTGSQESPAIGYDGSGNFVVVWHSYGSSGSDSSSSSIQGRIYTSNGVPVGPEAQVNTYTTEGQLSPEVAVRDDGSFVVVWHSYGSFDGDSSDASIQGRIYNSNGVPIGSEAQVNTYTVGPQARPAVAMNDAGAFVVVWDSFGSAGNDDLWSIQGQRFDSNGSPVGGEFQVNTYTTAYQFYPAVGMDAAGAFVVVWSSYGSFGTDSSSPSIQGRIYNSSGVPIGPEAQVNTYTTGVQTSPEVAVRDDGSFVVVWHSYGSSGSDSSIASIQGRLYNSNGVPVGPEAQINTYTTGSQRFPEVADYGEGNLLVVWQSEGSSGTDNSAESIQGRLYTSTGLPLGPDFQINTYTSSVQTSPAVEIDASGRGAVVWQSSGSYGTDTSDYSIQGQRFATPIFVDGFESGDTSAWSNSVP